MSTESTILANIEVANAMRRAGFKTKVHAIEVCPVCKTNHKLEIDQMLAKDSGVANILDWLTEHYPSCSEAKIFPSNTALTNYFSRYYLQSKEKEKLEQSIRDKFDPLLEGIRIYNLSKQRLNAGLAIEQANGGVPTQIVTELIRVKIDCWQKVVNGIAKIREVGSTADVKIINVQDNRNINLNAEDKKTLLDMAREVGLFDDFNPRANEADLMT
jgi:hypothetical protein